jgi:hypothetical protein
MGAVSVVSGFYIRKADISARLHSVIPVNQALCTPALI